MYYSGTIGPDPEGDNNPSMNSTTSNTLSLLME